MLQKEERGPGWNGHAPLLAGEFVAPHLDRVRRRHVIDRRLSSAHGAQANSKMLGGSSFPRLATRSSALVLRAASKVKPSGHNAQGQGVRQSQAT